MTIQFSSPEAEAILQNDILKFHFTRLGKDPGEVIDCPRCDGYGYQLDQDYLPNGDLADCWACQGSGRLTLRHADKVWYQMMKGRNHP